MAMERNASKKKDKKTFIPKNSLKLCVNILQLKKCHHFKFLWKCGIYSEFNSDRIEESA